MKFSEGDEIVIKRTGEEGVLIGFIDEQMAEVRVGDTEFPIFLEEIDHPYLRRFLKKSAEKKKVLREQIPVEKPAERALPLFDVGVFLQFVPQAGSPDDEAPETVKIFLVNGTAQAVRFRYEALLEQASLFAHAGVLHAGGSVYLHYVSWAEMLELPKFRWQTSADRDDMPAREGTLKIKSIKLYAHLRAFIDEGIPSFSYELPDALTPPPAAPEPPAFSLPPTKRVVRQMQDIPQYELDLHAEQLGVDLTGLSASEILHLQMKALERRVNAAIAHKQERLLVIHGIGNGTLRKAVAEMLRAQAFVHSLENGHLTGYGFGATLVHFKYT